MKNFKKFGALVFSLLIIASGIFVFNAFAVEYDGILYNLKSDSSGYVVTGVSNTFGGSLIIPEEIDGKPVIEIRQSAFKNYSEIGPEVKIPSGVKTVGNSAFQNCVGVKSVEFASGADTVKLGESAFSDCTDLSDITLPDKLSAIPEECFKNCSLVIVNIPEGVASVGDRAFIRNNTLEEVYLPSTLASIGEDAFFGCRSLTGFYVAQGNPSFIQSGGSLLSKDGKSFIQHALGNIPDNGAYSVPDGVTEILSGAFAFGALKSVIIPEGTQSIGKAAFSNCTKLESVAFPSSLKTIGENAFLNCSALGTVTIPAGVTNFTAAFYASGVKEVIFEDGVTAVSDDAFTNCKSLSKVTIPGSVTQIGSAFSGCSSLGEVYIPASVTQIAHDAFSNCASLKIKADEGSYAVEYAVAHNIPYELSNQDEPETPDEPAVTAVVLKIPGSGTVDYRTKVTVRASAQNLPDGARIVLCDENGNIIKNGSAYINHDLGEMTQTRTFTVKAVSSDGSTVENSDGTSAQGSFTITVNSGFFKRIIAWFRALFNALPEKVFAP